MVGRGVGGFWAGGVGVGVWGSIFVGSGGARGLAVEGRGVGSGGGVGGVEGVVVGCLGWGVVMARLGVVREVLVEGRRIRVWRFDQSLC